MCGYLTTVILPQSLTSIGLWFFLHTGLTDVAVARYDINETPEYVRNRFYQLLPQSVHHMLRIIDGQYWYLHEENIFDAHYEEPKLERYVVTTTGSFLWR